MLFIKNVYFSRNKQFTNRIEGQGVKVEGVKASKYVRKQVSKQASNQASQ